MFKLKTIRRLLVFVLAIAIFVSLPLSVHAEDPPNVYVLNRSSTNKQYVSPYLANYIYDNVEHSYIQYAIYSLYNTNDSSIIPGYCLDIETGAYADAKYIYRRLNLEDSTYSAAVADQIRAILTNGFYPEYAGAETMAANKIRIEAELDQLRTATGISNLSLGEAIAGTQAAIWQVVHGSRFEFTNFAKSHSTNFAQTVYGTNCKDEITNGHLTTNSQNQYNYEPIRQNIQSLFDYLLNPDRIASAQDTTKRVVSTASFVKLQKPIFSPDNNTLTVTATIDVDKDDVDTLFLKASTKTKSVETSISDGKQEYTLTITGVSDPNEKVTLSIYGTQSGRGIYLFDANGSRKTCQTMVGMDRSSMPVYAEVVAEGFRLINVKKSTANFVPISDIIFDIYYVSSSEDFIELKKDEEEFTKLENTLKNSMAEYILTTNNDGAATLNLTHYNLEDGVYLLVERYSPNVVKALDPFYVTIPITTVEDEKTVDGKYATRKTTDYEVTVYAKNELVNPPTGSIHLTKVDSKDSSKTLAGAQFEVYRAATPEEVQNKTATYISGLTTPVVLVPFYPTADLEGNTVSSVTSTEDGSIGIYGLEYGDYYLHEAKAPDGYNRLGAPIEITIDENSKDLAPITVNNEKGSLMPETGGMGTTLFTVAGSTLVCIACLFLYLNKRKTA